ncbi:zinc finger Ran-binding domain-containing protein 2-like isoform X2 [Rhizophagus clarus]|uniref:Zinc finger Ran-binding domain-containing protein 2-like isoform X2 n=1 Tax=Rhizophagus clarus TaxID=94130 RepID=A0A8H3M8T1_9GLOM|nr:zinc finger Ran-binding domain-containing protein 2-like isoform X2 [Rhizophagus clarus]
MGGNRHDKEQEYSSGVGSSYRRPRQEEGASSGEVGRDFASRYGGLFSEKDWKCPICSNINWARRPECNQCKTPKPGLETTMGSREGRGGGFMERDEIVEYRKSRDAEKDDEWDDFGRKRKRRENSFRSGKYSHNGSVVNDDFKSEKSTLESNKSGEELEEDGDDDDRWAAWDDIIGNEDSKEENVNKNKSTIYNERRTRRLDKHSHRRLSQSRSPHRRDRSLSRDRRSRKNIDPDLGQVVETEIESETEENHIVVDLGLFLEIGKGLITEVNHAQEVVTNIEVDLIQDQNPRTVGVDFFFILPNLVV